MTGPHGLFDCYSNGVLKEEGEWSRRDEHRSRGLWHGFYTCQLIPHVSLDNEFDCRF